MNSVDVIIPVYNYEKFIGEAINSILKQTWKDLKIIVVDDGSTDATAERVKEIQKSDVRVVLFQPGKVGIPAALNLALEKSTAPYIAFLDADDLWEKTKLEKQIVFLKINREVMICFTQIKEFETFDDSTQKQNFRARKEVMNGLVRDTFLGKRELFEKYGKFDVEKNSGEFILWFSPLIHDNCKYKILPEVLAYRRIHDNNLTRSINPKDYLKVIKAHLDAKKRNDN